MKNKYDFGPVVDEFNFLDAIDIPPPTYTHTSLNFRQTEPYKQASV